MDRTQIGLELGQRIGDLFGNLQAREKPLYTELRAIYDKILQRETPSDAAWLFLDLLDARFPSLYGFIISNRSVIGYQVENRIPDVSLVERMMSPVINPDGRGNGCPVMVIPFDRDIAQEDSIELMPRKPYSFMGFELEFDYDTKTASKNPIEDEMRSSSGKDYSGVLSSRFIGTNLNRQRQRAAEDLERILAAGKDKKITGYTIQKWNPESASNPNEPDYGIWITYEGTPIHCRVKILRDCIVIMPSFSHDNSRLNNLVLEAVSKNADLLTK